MGFKRINFEQTALSQSRPLVTLRDKTIAFNAEFVRRAGIGQCTRVAIFEDTDSFQLGFRFHSDESDSGSLALTQDGGQRVGLGPSDRGGRSVQTQTLLKRPWLRESLTVSSIRKFEPHKVHGLWVIDIGPGFEHESTDRTDVPADASGVYRYIHEGAVVYIGRGVIRSRMSEGARSDWEFDSVQYSILNDDVAEKRWESVFISRHRARHGDLPRYNKVAPAEV